MNGSIEMNDEAQIWLEDTLRHLGITALGPYEELKKTDLSMVQRVPTNAGSLFFKSTGHSALFEGLLSRHLSDFYPNRSVQVLAAHGTKPWFLMKGMDGSPLRKMKDKAIRKKVLQEYAELQVKETKHVEKLLKLGVPDRRLHVLKQEINDHLKDMCSTGLSEDETKKVMAIQSELILMCEQLENGIPPSLEHGDLHSGNIQYEAGHPIFYDWGDASVSHPFFSTRVFWHAIDELIESESEWLDTVAECRPYYLEPWTEFATMKSLERQLLIADQLACVYRGLSWHLYINPHRADLDDSKNKPAQWLQVLLEHRDLVKNTIYDISL